MTDFRTLGEHCVFEGRVFSVNEVQLAAPDGEQFERDVVRHPSAVSIVPLHEDGTITLVCQHRVPIGTSVLEAPAGTCDVAGEDSLSTARRELAEEAGLVAAQFELLGEIYNSPGYTDQRTRIFLATGLERCEQSPAGVEERWLTLERVPLASAGELIASGRLLDATTIVGLFLARAKSHL